MISFLFNSITGQPEGLPTVKLNSEDGFPHSEIAGSKLAHSSPTLIAACHVLRRLYMPRHPPNALTSHLRVHTTNDNAAKPIKNSKTKPQIMRIILSQPDNLFRLYNGIQNASVQYTATASIKKPIHNVKERRQSAKSTAVTQWKLLSSSLEKSKWWSLTGSNR